MDNKGVIYVPKLDPGRFGSGADSSGLKVLHKQVFYQGAYTTIACS